MSEDGARGTNMHACNNTSLKTSLQNLIITEKMKKVKEKQTHFGYLRKMEFHGFVFNQKS